jgi:hypothetical protein
MHKFHLFIKMTSFGKIVLSYAIQAGASEADEVVLVHDVGPQLVQRRAQRLCRLGIEVNAELRHSRGARATSRRGASRLVADQSIVLRAIEAFGNCGR